MAELVPYALSTSKGKYGTGAALGALAAMSYVHLPPSMKNLTYPFIVQNSDLVSFPSSDPLSPTALPSCAEMIIVKFLIVLNYWLSLLSCSIYSVI